MNWLRLKQLQIANFGPFEGTHTIDFNDSGFFLIKGKVSESSVGSGAGKSFFLKGISHIFGGCKTPATELQSWFSKEAPEAVVLLETSDGLIEVKRKNGLSISGALYKEPIKGKAAEAELDKIFRMDKESRGIVTYRGQRKPGLFLSLNDEKKKTFLWDLLELGVYEKIAEEAEKKVDKLGVQLANVQFQEQGAVSSVANDKISLENALKELEILPDVEKEVLQTKKNVDIKRQKISDINKSISGIRIQNQQELDAVLATVKAKLKPLLQTAEPIQVTALRKQSEEIKSTLDRLKEQDALIVINAEKQKGSLKTKIATQKAVVSKKTHLLTQLQNLKDKESVLLSQKCSECKRQWAGEDADKKLEEIKASIDATNKELERVKEAEAVLASLEKELADIKYPGANPEIVLTQGKIFDIASKAKELLQLAAQEKNDKVNTLEQEEKQIRNEFAQELAQKLLEISKEEKELQASLACDLSADQRLSGILSQRRIKLAVIEEKRSTATKNKECLDQTQKSKKQVEEALALEKDIVALIGKKGFLGVVVEEVLMEIAAATNDILAQVANVQHISVAFETEKTAETSGNTTARITLVVYNNGRRVSFDTGISGGQQSALELAVDLGVGDVVSNRRGVYPGFLILDEAFDGLDNTSKESCLEMLKEHSKNKLILVVDHDSHFQGLFDNIIEIESLDGRSRLVV